MSRKIIIGSAATVIVIAIVTIFLAYQSTSSNQTVYENVNQISMKISSPAFTNNGSIPSQHTCDAAETSPELVFSDVPSEAGSLALIMEDPDIPAPAGEDRIWDHWLVWNIPPSSQGISEAGDVTGTQGLNTSGKIGYQGPCPPDREHRYFFKLFALDTELDLAEGASKTELLKAMDGHIIQQAELVGLYNRQ